MVAIQDTTTNGDHADYKDAWIAQLVGGTAKYGNGIGELITIGPAPNETTGDPDFKSRGLFQFPLTDIASFTSISEAFLELTVGPNTCLGTRGDNIRLLCELALDDFNEANPPVPSNNCSLGSGTGLGRWPGPAVSVTDRAFVAEDDMATGDKITFDVSDIIGALHDTGPPPSGTWYVRFRVISANGDGTAYDEANDNRRVSVYAREDATVANRPLLTVTGSSGNVTKAFSDSGVWTDTFTVAASGGDTTIDDAGVATDSFSVGVSPAFRTYLDTAYNGVAEIILPTANSEIAAWLPIESQGVRATNKFYLDAKPNSGEVTWYVMAHLVEPARQNMYRLAVVINSQQQMTLIIQKVVDGFVFPLRSAVDTRTFVPLVNYWCQFQIEGSVVPLTLTARIWREGELVPGWTVAVEDSETVLAAGGMAGIGAAVTNVSNLPMIITFDTFTVIDV